jgi:hypothetical protein
MPSPAAAAGGKGQTSAEKQTGGEGSVDRPRVTRQNVNDGDDHEHFDQSERPIAMRYSGIHGVCLLI